MYFYRPDGTGIGSISQTSASSVAFNTTSDRRLKENIHTTQSGLQKLNKINVYDYNYITDPMKTQVQGFLAQDLYKIYPQAVSVGGDDPKTQPWQVDYSKIVPLLVKSVQDLSKENETLKKQNSALEKRLKRLENALGLLPE